MTTTNSTLPTLSGESSLSAYLDKINRMPYLNEEDEYMLAKRWTEHQSLDAAHQLATSHLRLVAKIALGYRGYGLPLTELISEGNIGLMQAIRKFNPERGFRLSTYAMWWIKASIQEYVLRSWSLVKIGTTAAQKKLFFNLRRIKSRLQKIDNTALTDDEVSLIAQEIDVPEKDVVEMNSRLTQNDQSLNTPMLGDEGESREMIDYLEHEGDNQEVILADKQDVDYKKQLFLQALDTLNEREQAIIRRRHLGQVVDTLEVLSQDYKVSRERVRQIEARAIEKIQQYIAEHYRD